MKNKIIKITMCFLMLFTLINVNLIHADTIDDSSTNQVIAEDNEKEEIQENEEKPVVELPEEEKTIPTENTTTNVETLPTEENLGNEPNKETVDQSKEDTKKETSNEMSNIVGKDAVFLNNGKMVTRSGDKLNLYRPEGSHIFDIGSPWRTYLGDVEPASFFTAELKGQKVYCVQPMVNIIDQTGDYVDTPMLNQFNATLTKKLAYISKLGFGFQGDTSHEMEWATQIRIWQELHNQIGGANYPDVYEIQPSIQAKLNAINKRLNVMYNAVSFDNEDVTFNGIGEENAIILRDTSNTLSSYVINSKTEGIECQKVLDDSGEYNSLKMWLNKSVVEGEIRFDCLYLLDGTFNPIVYKSSTSQDVASFGAPDPTRSRIKFHLALGSLQIAKQNEEGTRIPNTEFKLSYNADMSDPIGTYKTGSDGTVKIDELYPQAVYAQEVSVPANLVLDPTIHQIKVVSNETVSYTQTNAIQKGKITLNKVDIETATKAQGDATLQGATYGLFARENIVDPITNKVLITKGIKVCERTTKADGSMDPIENLYLGEYYVQELVPSTGYTLNNEKINVSLSYGGASQSVVVKGITSKETIIDGDFQITKIYTEEPYESEVSKPEKGAVFQTVLKKYVTKYGTLENAWQHRNEFNSREYDELTTDKDGIALSKKLVYGTYVIKQVKAGHEDATLVKESFEAVIKDQNQETIKYVVNNKMFTSYLQIVKKDSETGKIVTLSKTSFKIYDVDHKEYLSQRVGLSRIDIWITNEEGKVTLPRELNAGNYRLEEIKAPNGYLINKKGVDFTIKSTHISMVDEEGEPITVVEMKNEKPTGSISLVKSDLDSKELLSGVQYQLTAGKDVIDPADGSIIYNAGDAIFVGLNEDGYYTTDEKGEINVTGLPLGTYSWKETKALDGYVKDTNTYTFTLAQKDDATKIYTNHQALENQKSKVEILKEDKDGKALIGAKLHLSDSKDNVIKEWTSDKDVLRFEGLLVGEEYTLYEDEAPQGYVLSKPISFTIANTNDVQEIKMIDNQISVAKTDAAGKKLPAAKLQVVSNKTKNIVDQWTSDEKEHMITGLIEDGEYTLIEVKAPEGYVAAKNIQFVANNDTTDLTMVDLQVKVEKSDVNGEKLPRAQMQVVAKETGDIIDEWTTDGKEHSISGLNEGKEYILQEVEAPKGYVLSKDVAFTANKETTKIEMLDKQVSASKFDEDDKALKGAKLQVVSTKTKNIVEQWTSDEKEHMITGLIEGGEYLLQELEAPEGLEKADDIKFTVSDKKSSESLKMVDKYILTKIQVNKVDKITKKAIKSKRFMFTAYKDKECKNVLTTVNANEKDGTATFELRYGEWYIKETKAPLGYLLSDEVKHVVINKDGVFVNDKKVEAEDAIYSFIYFNAPLRDDVIKTGDDTIKPYEYAGLILLSISTIVILRRKKKELKN